MENKPTVEIHEELASRLPRYSELPKSKFDEAVYFISKWRPETAVEKEIENINRQGKLKLVQ
ncbi:MAG: ORF6C domain-containing protein [Psychrobacillus sp.]